MTEERPNRRQFMKLTGAAALTGLAGCSGQTTSDTTATGTGTGTAGAGATEANATQTSTTAPGDQIKGPREGDDLPKDQNPSNGYPPEFQNVPEERNIDTSSYEVLTREVDGSTVDVPLVPIEDAFYWYARGEARFVDARSETGYDVSHIFGAVLSPAPDGLRYDPTDDWNTNDRVVTYCHCPHHLSSLRAASLLEQGYDEVYAIDEGFQAWLDRQYPLAGSDTNRDYTVRTIKGTTSSADAGETAWAIHPSSDQVEATEIASDGSYTLELKFVKVDSQSTIRIETPSYSIEASLGVLTNGTVTAKTGSAVNATATGTARTNGTSTNNTTSTSTAAWTDNGTATGNSTSDNNTFSLNRFF